ncbi:MFS general substrate transporter [Echria macrotheca]|uniref:MFS general substrate transporter n=1 Tax=Echria macrotheca TaxID=438768 RepID=A0AAJ0B719_9PEZI|nr:MFS general substrate transporter [Echria macrotheca]
MTSPLVGISNRGSPAGNASQKPARTSRKKPKPEPLSGTSRDGSIERPNAQQNGQDATNEQSPLLSPASNEDDGFLDGPANDGEDEHQATKSIWYMILLTISIGGLQIAWSVEMSNGSPYLLSLGISKSVMALVWIAGPLSGTLVQPYVGMLSDKCRIPWGKRKPFMLGGAAATILSLMFLSWTREIVAGFLGALGIDAESAFVHYSVIVMAVLCVYVLDFAINTAAIRAFIVDCAPTHQQETANAMASRFVGVGSITGYLAGFVNLSTAFWWLGDTQFKELCAIASIILAITVIVSCVFIRERDPRLEGPPPKDKPGVFSFFKQVFTSIKRLPPQTTKVCEVQIFAWVGFFPMLFYTSEYIAEIYAEPYLEANPHMSPEELDKLYETATQVGTFALLIFSITGLATNVFLPFFIAPTFDNQGPVGSDEGAESSSIKNYDEEQKSWLDYLVIPGFTLRRAWMFSQILFCGCMLCTVFVRTVEAATALIGLVGITWALTLWAPWAIISAEISRRDEVRRAQRQSISSPDRGPVASLDGYSSDENNTHDLSAEDDDADQAGVILGIHNMAIAAPQIIATVVSSIIFRVFQKPRGTPGDHSIAIVLALGGISVLISAFFIYRIKDDPDVPTDLMSAIEEGEPESRPSTSHSRSRSYEQLPRASLERATLVRNKSFSGAEY